MNAHRPHPGLDSLSMHQHDYPWHGYLLLQTEPSNTTYLTPSSHVYLNLKKNSNNILVMLPGGIQHSVLSSSLNPRVSIAFDLTYGQRLFDRIVSHPSVEYPQKYLDDGANTWLELITDEQLKNWKKSAGLELHTVNFNQIRASYALKEGENEEKDNSEHMDDVKWGGVIDIKKLLDELRIKTKDDL